MQKPVIGSCKKTRAAASAPSPAFLKPPPLIGFIGTKDNHLNYNLGMKLKMEADYFSNNLGIQVKMEADYVSNKLGIQVKMEADYFSNKLGIQVKMEADTFRYYLVIRTDRSWVISTSKQV